MGTHYIPVIGDELALMVKVRDMLEKKLEEVRGQPGGPEYEPEIVLITVIRAVRQFLKIAGATPEETGAAFAQLSEEISEQSK